MLIPEFLRYWITNHDAQVDILSLAFLKLFPKGNMLCKLLGLQNL